MEFESHAPHDFCKSQYLFKVLVYGCRSEGSGLHRHRKASPNMALDRPEGEGGETSSLHKDSKVKSFKRYSVMDKKSVKKVNKFCKGAIIAAAAAIAVLAWIYNPAHMFTAALVFAFGLEYGEPLKEEDYDII